MKKSFRLLITAMWLILFPLTLAAQEDNQVIIIGKQVTSQGQTTEDHINTILGVAQGIPLNFEGKRTTQNFEVRITNNRLKMFAKIKERTLAYNIVADSTATVKELPGSGRNYKAILDLYFTNSGQNLNMDIYTNLEEVQTNSSQTTDTLQPSNGVNQAEMVKIASARVPKSAEAITVSESIQNLVNSGGSAGSPWKGHPTSWYRQRGKKAISPSVFGLQDQSTSGKIMQRTESSLKLANVFIGSEILREYYGKVVSGGFDLVGADESSLLANVLYFFNHGTPVKIKENQTTWVALNHQGGGPTIGKTEINTDIYNVYTNYVDLPEGTNTSMANGANSEAAGQTNSSMANAASQGSFGSGSQSDQDTTASYGQSTEDDSSEGGCDCSCEKYAELMAMGKKKKKDMDISKMQQIDMSCIQSCTMAWANCARKKKK